MGRLCFVETLTGVGLQSTESTKGEIRVQKGCGGMPDVDCDYWNCSYCNYWNDGKKGNTDAQNDSENISPDDVMILMTLIKVSLTMTKAK